MSFASVDAVRFQVALTRAKLARLVERVYRAVAPRLPHRLVCCVLAHVGAATIRDDETVADVAFMELFRRWDHREMRGRAARRHPRRGRE